MVIRQYWGFMQDRLWQGNAETLFLLAGEALFAADCQPEFCTEFA